MRCNAGDACSQSLYVAFARTLPVAYLLQSKCMVCCICKHKLRVKKLRRRKN